VVGEWWSWIRAVAVGSLLWAVAGGGGLWFLWAVAGGGRLTAGESWEVSSPVARIGGRVGRCRFPDKSRWKESGSGWFAGCGC
jgi:hypothetical protein